MSGIEAAVIVALVLAIVALTGGLGAVVYLHGRERRDWALERRSLVDRAIARAPGEVIAMDRVACGLEKEKKPPVLVEGMS